MELQSFEKPSMVPWVTGGPISYEVVKIYKVGKHNKFNSLTAMGSGGNKKTSCCTFQLGTYRQTSPPWWASADLDPIQRKLDVDKGLCEGTVEAI
jgi:hypothetical protein